MTEKTPGQDPERRRNVGAFADAPSPMEAPRPEDQPAPEAGEAQPATPLTGDARAEEGSARAEDDRAAVTAPAPSPRPTPAARDTGTDPQAEGSPRGARRVLVTTGLAAVAAAAVVAGVYYLAGDALRAPEPKAAADAQMKAGQAPAAPVKAPSFRPGEFRTLPSVCNSVDAKTADCLGATADGKVHGKRAATRDACRWVEGDSRALTVESELFRPDTRGLRASTLAIEAFAERRDLLADAEEIEGVGDEAIMYRTDGDVHVLARDENVLVTVDYARNDDPSIPDAMARDASAKTAGMVLGKLQPV